jgi:hypothetical protein
MIELLSCVKREAENVGVCIAISFHDHLLNDLDGDIPANRNHDEVEEEN